MTIITASTRKRRDANIGKAAREPPKWERLLYTTGSTLKLSKYFIYVVRGVQDEEGIYIL